MNGGAAMPSGGPSGAGFFVCDFPGARAKTDMGSLEHPMFSLATRPDLKVMHYARGDVSLTVTPSVRGRATIHDKDILIYCTSQLVAALNAGAAISRTLTMKAHDFLVATGRDTGGDSYVRLREAFERLAGTRITTNLVAGDREITSGFGLIESWEIVRRARGGRMAHVRITLSEWLFAAIRAKSVLTLSAEYFALRKPLERRIYELARKHCGNQPTWRVSVAVLHEKSGSQSPLRVFRAALRRMIVADGLPGYRLEEETGDMIRVSKRRAPAGQGPLLEPDALEAARALAPGWDVHGLEAEWRGFWEASGRPTLRSPRAAFLGWLKGRVARG